MAGLGLPSLSIVFFITPTQIAMRNHFLLLTSIIVFNACHQEEPIVPNYMLELFDNQSCSDEKISFVKLTFPDSVLYISDTMNQIKLYEEYGLRGVGAGLSEYKLSGDNIEKITTYQFQLLSQSEENELSKLIKPGSYLISENIPNGGLGSKFTIIINGSSEWLVYYGDVNSNFFHIYGAHGNDFEMHVCGAFDLLLTTETLSAPVPVLGEFELTFRDSFL